MKRLSLLLIFVLLLSCSTDNNNSSNSSIQINPPDWIIGTWLIESTTNFGWRFESIDVIQISNIVETSLKGQVEFWLDAGEDASASDSSTNDSYRLELNFPAGQTIIHVFNKISDTEITWEASPTTVYVKQ